ncbi:dTDP-4-dehydrorhamnose reductase [Methylotuvimicrobium sp. KM1]|uniref:dTDP-4-dehydrorhamnose reductase n=1 Tax=Methylotuvimicrobium sp. KM1 TaxID=3377707 RepID=UPI00384C4E53
MNILLLGKNGQVGRELQRTLLPLGHVSAFGRDEADLQNPDALLGLLKERKPEIIVNAAAYTAVDKAETDEKAAYAINAEAVDVLAQYTSTHDALFVHYSTDYVFDGEKKEAYLETDTTDPQSIYGKSKRAGEEAILKSQCNALIFRTSWVFSADGNNFIKTILRLAQERDSLNIVADQFGAPTCAELIADVTAHAIIGFRRDQLTGGIYHLTSGGETTWHGLACYAVQRANENGMQLKLKPENIQPISTEAYPLPAKRPKNSRLNTGSLANSLELHFPDWRLYVDRVIRELCNRD